MILKDLKNNERGSITVLVLSTMLLVVGIIFIAYFSMMNKSSSQQAQLRKIQEEYEVSDSMMDQAYDENYDPLLPGEVADGNENYIDSNGDEAYVPDGFEVLEEASTVEDGLVIQDANGNQFVWIPVPEESIDTLYVRNTGYEHTDISAETYTDTGYLPDVLQPASDTAEANEAAEKEAVRAAGGFWVSRFEAGNENGTLVSKQNVTVYGTSQAESKQLAKNFIVTDEVRSALCSGIQWDIIMKTIDGKLDGKGNTYNVTSYNTSRHKGSSVGVTNTGINEADRVYNIYDLEGNAGEFVAERTDYSSWLDPTLNGTYIYRGGNYMNSKSSLVLINYRIKPASYRINGAGTGDSASSFRIILYLIK